MDMRRHANFDPSSPEAGRASEYLYRLYPALFRTAGLDPEAIGLRFDLTGSQQDRRLHCLSDPHPDHADTRFDITHLIHQGYGTEEMMWHAEEVAASYAWLDRRRGALSSLGVVAPEIPLWSLQTQVFARRALDLGLAEDAEMQKRASRRPSYEMSSARTAVPRSPVPDRIEMARLDLGRGGLIKTSDKGVVTLEIADTQLPHSLMNGIVGTSITAIVGHPILDDPRIVVRGVSQRKGTLVIRLNAPFDPPSPPAGTPADVAAIIRSGWEDRGMIISAYVAARMKKSRSRK